MVISATTQESRDAVLTDTDTTFHPRSAVITVSSSRVSRAWFIANVVISATTQESRDAVLTGTGTTFHPRSAVITVSSSRVSRAWFTANVVISATTQESRDAVLTDTGTPFHPRSAVITVSSPRVSPCVIYRKCGYISYNPRIQGCCANRYRYSLSSQKCCYNRVIPKSQSVRDLPQMWLYQLQPKNPRMLC